MSSSLVWCRFVWSSSVGQAEAQELPLLSKSTEASDRRPKSSVSEPELSLTHVSLTARVSPFGSEAAPVESSPSDTHGRTHACARADGWGRSPRCKINGSSDSQSNARQPVSIANQTAGGVNDDELDSVRVTLVTAGEHLTFNAPPGRKGEQPALMGCSPKGPELEGDS